jgi:demethylmenaquinone methyltransferase/2-methoxy-6-polyprenyl-1,4-benzoquinol methylase
LRIWEVTGAEWSPGRKNMNGLADYYGKRAPQYERIYHKPERQTDLRVLREHVAQIFAGRRVLEVACGTGWWTEVMADSAESVLATDINEEVLAIAKAKPLDPTKISFHRRDAFRLEEVKGSFDAGLAAFWWSHLMPAELDRFLSSFHAALQPGSVVVFIDNIYVEGSSTPISRCGAGGNTYQLRKLDDGTTTEVLKNFPTDKEIAEALHGRATDLQINRLTYYWRARYLIPNVAARDRRFPSAGIS